MSELKPKMSIEEAIAHAKSKAAELGDCECAKEHLQLAEWLEELAFNRRAQPNEPLTCDGCERLGTGANGFVGPKMCIGCIRKWQAQCVDHYRCKPEQEGVTE